MAGPKLLTFAQWRKQAVGKHIDIDGAYGAQCWDLWADYAFRAHGATGIMPWTSTNAGADSGLASSLWLRFPARQGIDGLFSRIGRHETPYEGDVAVWARSQPFPDSHVAVSTGRTRPGLIECVSQNDLGNANTAAGATRVTWLTTGGLLGYLRPKTSTGLTWPSNAAPDLGQEEDEDMATRPLGHYIGGSIATPAKDRKWVIYYPDSGLYMFIGGVGQEYINTQAQAHGTKPFTHISEAHWADQLRPHLDKILAG